ncbi:MAG: hypothetical protein ABIJ24_05355 [Nitrospinota bacterium]
MGKILTLLFIILLAFASVDGYLFLSEKISAGERQIADGQRQLEEGRAALKEGKAKLEDGKQELSGGKKKYEQAKGKPLLVLADRVLKGGKGFKEAEGKIAEGDKKVAEGEGRVYTGEKQIAAGELKLRIGMEKLRVAKVARFACALATAFFTLLSIVLGFRWRRSLARIFMHTDT